MKNKTIDYYNNNAAEYANTTLNLNIKEKYDEFTKNIKFGGKIMDVGCGSGRDLIEFKNRGYDVIGIDYSIELVKIAQKNSKSEVYHKDFNEINWINEFDGVWCMAALLHLKKEDLIDVLNRIAVSMKKDASFYCSFKHGEGELFDNNDRFFSYYSKEDLQKIFNDVKFFKDIKIESSIDKLGRIDTKWIDVYCKLEKIELNNKYKKIKP